MNKAKLGSSDLMVSEICLGSMNWGQQCSEADAHEQLDYATSHGVNFIDTAEIYPVPPSKETQGLTETYIGNWLHTRGRRDDLILASKVAPAAELIRTRHTGNPAVLTRTKIRDAIEGSLSRLQTDYIDLYQVHWPERSTNFFGVRGVSELPHETVTPILETLTALSELVSEGKVRYLGVSNETPWGLFEYLRSSERHNLQKIVSIQNQYSLTNRTFEIGLSEMCLRENIGLLTYSSLGMGVLSGKYLHGAQPAGARFTLYYRNRHRYNPEHAQAAIEAYVAIADKYHLDPSQMALAFARQQAFVSSVIIGATTMQQLQADIKSADITLDDAVIADINDVHVRMPDVTH
jgi:aryl-alcohol dehydrogenase-like predicted oxidoreductase